MDEKRGKRDYEIRVAFGKRLLEFRNKHDLTQEQFGDNVGLSQHRYSQIEQGKVDFKISTIIKIVSAYEELSDLFTILAEEISKWRDISDMDDENDDKG